MLYNYAISFAGYIDKVYSARNLSSETDIYSNVNSRRFWPSERSVFSVHDSTRELCLATFKKRSKKEHFTNREPLPR